MGLAALGRLPGFFRRRWALAILAVPVALWVGVVVADYFLDEPFRRELERRMNDRLEGYTVSVRRADVHLLGLAFDLEDLVVVQQAHPEPPVARIPRLSAGVHWRALLHGAIVARFRFDQPAVAFDLNHFRAEQRDPKPVARKGWQEALQSIYPFKINQLLVVDGDVRYQDVGSAPPLHLSRVNLEASNIRNVHSRAKEYPSPIGLEAVVFEKGRLRLDGQADFMAEPHLGVKADIEVESIPLDYFKPITERYNVTVRSGAVSGAGTMEYAPDGRTLVHLREVRADRLDVDWVHTAVTKANEAEVARQAKETARKVSNAPSMHLRVDHAVISHSTVGFVNAAVRPRFRVFIADTELDLKNLSNHFTEGAAELGLRGKFMGSGPTVAQARFRPEKKGPDLDVAVRIENTDMRTMNDLLRAYGKFDVVRGVFAFYSELTVKNGRVEGYVKPLFRDLDAYDERQDKDKSAFRKLYEKLVGGVSKLLENRPRQEVATKAEVTGSLDDPKTSTGEVIVNLIQNAFFRAILPGFDEELQRLRG
jgi:Domain of Unknown Function (DUF748)